MTDVEQDRPLEAEPDPSEEVTFTRGALEAAAEEDRKNRAPRTAGQVGIGGAVLIVADWIVGGFLAVDLDPKNPDSVELPTTVSAALLVLGGYLVARWMNRARPTA